MRGRFRRLRRGVLALGDEFLDYLLLRSRLRVRVGLVDVFAARGTLEPRRRSRARKARAAERVPLCAERHGIALDLHAYAALERWRGLRGEDVRRVPAPKIVRHAGGARHMGPRECKACTDGSSDNRAGTPWARRRVGEAD